MSDWKDPDGCYMDSWANEVYPTEKALRVARAITSIDRDLGHAIASLELALEQADMDIPDNKDWDAWRTAYQLQIKMALNALEELVCMSDDITDVVMWEMVDKPEWFKVRDEPMEY